jgi:hypothetical protein
LEKHSNAKINKKQRNPKEEYINSHRTGNSAEATLDSNYKKRID